MRMNLGLSMQHDMLVLLMLKATANSRILCCLVRGCYDLNQRGML